MQILEPSPKSAGNLAPQMSGRGRSNSHAHATDPRWQLTQRIAASGTLGRSRLLSDFLLYVVDRHICDRTDEITEQQIGVLVFGRAEGYDSNDDNIVRSYARNLRRRIEEYFATEGKEETLLLEIPRGGYSPCFSPRRVETATEPDSFFPSIAKSPQEVGQADHPSPAAPVPDADAMDLLSTRAGMKAPDPIGLGVVRERTAPSRNFSEILLLSLGLALGVACSFLQPLTLLKHLTASPAEAASRRFWTQLFNRDRDTFIVPSDDGLIIMQGLTERPVPLASYIDGSYRTNLKAENDPGEQQILKLGRRRYTSVVDLDLVARLVQLDEVTPGRLMVRYARDLRMDDLRAGNAILIGSVEANPWIELFQPRMSFRFSINAGSDKPSGIVNEHQRVGEKAIYGTPGPDHTYGVIAYLPNLTSTGHVLIVAGLNTAGTEAAATFLLTPSLMMPTLQRARSTHGGFEPFELLIGAGNVAANASTPQLILERIGSSS
jgi:hypothetical protein